MTIVEQGQIYFMMTDDDCRTRSDLLHDDDCRTRSDGVSIKSSLASMMATVEGYLSRNTIGIVPFTCPVDGYHTSSFNW